MHDAKEIEETGKDVGSSNSGDSQGTKIPKIPNPKIPNKLQIIKDVMSKIIKKKAFKIGLVIIGIVFIVIVILDILEESEKDNGKYIEGDYSNVPYVVDSQVINNLTITTDGVGGFKYAFVDSEGNIIDLNTALDNALKTLKDNNCTALQDMGKNDEEQKELLKKLVQAELATQYPDLSISGFSSGTSSSSSNAVNGIDFCVDTSNTNSLPVLNEEQLTQIVNNSNATQEGKENMLSVIPDLVKYQEQYKVNAVFFMAVAYAESGWGVGWDLIDPSTYNWISIKGSHGGGYIDYNGTSWNVYTSYSDAAEYFFNLISDPDFVYFGAQKYTIYDIAPTYCNIGWGDTTSKFIQDAYESIGITPNSADSPTASGGQGNTSTSNSSSGGNTDTSENNIAVSDETGWLWTISFENFNAYLYHHNNPRVNYTDLYVKGYITEDRKNYIVTSNSTGLYAGPGVSLPNNAQYFSEYGVDVSSLSDGSEIDADIVEKVSKKAYDNMLAKVKDDATTQGATLSENQAEAAVDTYYLNGPYSTATNLGSLYTQYGDTEDLANNYIGFSYVDSADSASTRSECVWALFHFGEYHSLDSNFNEMLESGEINGLSSGNSNIPGGGSKGDIQGKIKIQRKDENGNTRILTYTDPTTFKSMISSKNSNVMNYYTLESSSGSGVSSGINGVKLQGSDVAEQIWNFFINDMGYSEYVAAGIMGNIMEESGGQTLNIDPSAQNSIGNGHYGIIQWDMVYCSEVVGKDLAGQLEFYSSWIQSGEFDNYAKNYKSGFSYQEFLEIKDPEQVAIAFATVMERYEGYVGNVWQSYAVTGSTSKYEQRMENARNAYATLAGTTSESSSSSESSNSSSGNSLSSKKNSSSTSNLSSSGGNQSFVQIAIDCHKYLNDNEYHWSSGRAMPVVRGESEKRIDCAAYVSWCLYEYGIYKESWQLTSGNIIDWGKSNLETIFEGSAMSVSDIPQIQPGDIIIMDGHTQIFYGFNDSGTAVWLNCGSNDAIVMDEGTDAYNDFWKPVLYVFRVPGGGKAVVNSLDNFLFIGDSRYDGTIENELESLGSNITAIGVGSSQPANWLDATANGSGFVAQGYSSSGENVTLPDSVDGVSILLGTNALTQISEMEEMLNNLHARYPEAPIFVNSVYHVGTAYTYTDKDVFNKNVDSFNSSIRDFCNQNDWAYYIDITQNLDDNSGYLKAEYSGDGLHISSTEGITTLIDNIKNEILNSGTSISSSDNSTSSSAGGYRLVVANKKVVNTTVVDNYSYTGETYAREKNSGAKHTGLSRSTETPASQTIKSSTTTTYSTTEVDYQGALKEYTLYFDFLWAVLINSSGDRDLISSWADLAINGNVTITVYNDVSTSSTSSSIDKGPYAYTIADSSNSLAIYDVYSVTEVTTIVTKTTASKPTITNADTWLIKYTNEANTYSEFKRRNKEKIIEKTDPDATEDNVVKLLQKNKTKLTSLINEEDTVAEMLEENEKVNFMIDIYSYVLQVADGKSSDEIKLNLDGLLDTSVFDLTKSESTSTRKVLLYTSLNLTEPDKELLYEAVEKICGPYGNSDENANRKKYVTCVILNRMMSSEFPNTVNDVLKQRYQFQNLSVQDLSEDKTYTDETKQIVDNAIITGDCSQYSVYFTIPSNAEKLDWDNKYKFTFNDGDKSDSSFNYYTEEDIVNELKKYETAVEFGMTVPSSSAQAIVAWAEAQVGKSSFYNKHHGQNMISTNYCTAFVESAYYEAGLEYFGGDAKDLPHPNEIKYKDDGRVDWSDIPVGAIIVSKGVPVGGIDYGHVCLYVGNGYVIEAGGSTITKSPIDDSYGGAGHNCAPFLGWGFAMNDQDEAREKLVVSIGRGNYAEGWTSLIEDAAETGISGVYQIEDHTFTVYIQDLGPWANEPYSASGSYAAAACGATSVSIILTGYGNDVTPYDVGSYIAISLGLPVGTTSTAVTSFQGLCNALDHWGVKHTGFVNASRDQIVEHLEQGDQVIMCVQSSRIGNERYGGHYVTLLGMNSEGQILLGDPARKGVNSGYFDQEDIFCANYNGVCFISK